MKKIRSISILLMFFSVALFTIQCQHDNEDIIPVKGPDPIVRGNEVIDCPDCNNGGASKEVWYFDKAHSNVGWETQYKGLGSLLTGRFNYFVVQSLHFEEANPQNISFSGYVWLNSVNTGEPGRDGGCLAGNGETSTFKTTPDMTTEAANQATLVSKPGTGRYSTTDEGFLIDADFSFLGVTKTVTVKFFFYPKTDIGTAFMSGISAQYDFNAISDYAVGSTNIADKVTVKINALVRYKKP